jgi:hypothetical protein
VTFTHTRTLGGVPTVTTFKVQDGNLGADVLRGSLDGGGFANTSVQFTRQ